MLERGEEEVRMGEMEFDNNLLHLLRSPDSTSWQIEQLWEPDMLHFDCSSFPANPMEELTRWANSLSHHHHESGAAKVQAQAFDAQLQGDNVVRGALPMNDWRYELLPDSRQRIGNKLFVTLRRNLPVPGEEELLELRKIAVRFEERVYIAATSQSDYLRKISLKILTVETKSQNPVCGKTVQVVEKSSKVQFDAKSPPQESTLHNLQGGEECALLDPFHQQPVTEHGNLKRKGDTGPCQDHTIFELGNKQKMDMQLDAKSPPQESTLHNLQGKEECALLDPIQQRSVTEHGNLKREGDTVPSGQDHTIFELGNKEKMDKKLKKTWGIGGSISLDDLKQQFGKKRKEAAESLDVSISTFKRICREHGIPRWPSNKIKRDRLLLSMPSSNETAPVAGGTQISISTTPTAFASTKVLVKSNQQKSWSSNLSLDDEIRTSLYDDVLRNDEGTDGENIMIQEGDSTDQEVLYKPQEFEPPCDNPILVYPLHDAPMILAPLPQETVPAKESRCQQGEEIARQTEMADGTSHLEKQYLGSQRLGCNTEKEVIVSVEESSSHDFRNVSEPNQDHLADFVSLHEVNKDQLISMDHLESNCIKAQSILESKSEPSLQNNASRMKLIFGKLITLPLEDLTNPNHEASMKEALTILAGNLSLFAEEQAKQLLELKFDFPTIMYSWRDCSQSRIDCRNFLAEFEKTKSLLETSTKEEEDLKDRYTQLESKEKEMMAQLEAIQKEKNEVTKQRSENFNQTKHLSALAEEQAGRTKEKELQMTIASDRLDKLKSQWISVQSSFN